MGSVRRRPGRPRASDGRGVQVWDSVAEHQRIRFDGTELDMHRRANIEHVSPVAAGIVRRELRRFGDVAVGPHDDAVAEESAAAVRADL